MEMMSAGAGQGFAKLVNDGNPAEWAFIAAAVGLGWFVMPALFRRGRPGLACSLAGVLCLAWGAAMAGSGRPAPAITACLGLAACWLGAAIFIGRKRSRSTSQSEGQPAESSAAPDPGHTADPDC